MLAALALMAVVSGCSGASSEPAAEGAPSAPGPSTGQSAAAAGCQQDLTAALCVTASVKGRATHQGTSKADLGVATCAEWLKRDKAKLRFPVFFDTLDGVDFGFDTFVTDFKGAGTYGKDSLSGIGMPFGVTAGKRFEEGSVSTVTLTLEANGSGTITFEDFVDLADPEPQPGVESGSITFTCVDARL